MGTIPRLPFMSLDIIFSTGFMADTYWTPGCDPFCIWKFWSLWMGVGKYPGPIFDTPELLYKDKMVLDGFYPAYYYSGFYSDMWNLWPEKILLFGLKKAWPVSNIIELPSLNWFPFEIVFSMLLPSPILNFSRIWRSLSDWPRVLQRKRLRLEWCKNNMMTLTYSS